MRSIYLLLDMQNDLIHPDGPNGNAPFGQEAARRDIVARSVRAIERARQAGCTIGFVRVGFSPDYRQCPTRSPVFGAIRQHGLLKLGDWGAELHPNLPVQPGDLQVVKHRVSPFHATSLELQLRTLGIERIYCSGVSTQAVVQAAARDAHDRDFEVVVLEDCCSADSADEHARSIQSVAMFASIEDSTGAFRFGAS